MPIMSVYASHDSYVDRGAPADNFNAVGWLIIGEIYGDSPNPHGTDVCSAWLQFDLSSIPAYAIINSATLRINIVYSVDDYADESYKIMRCTNNSWAESSITLNNAPSTFGAELAFFVVNSDTGPGIGIRNIDIKPLVEAALASGAISLRIDNDGNGGNGIWITDGEYFGGASSINPKLTIDYTARRRTCVAVLAD